jgi:hypothetical protein
LAIASSYIVAVWDSDVQQGKTPVRSAGHAGHLFICRLCGKGHNVPDEQVPYWHGRRNHLLIAGRELGIELERAEKSGPALYSGSD